MKVSRRMKPMTCRHCGCTDRQGCQIHLGYGSYITCYWVEPGLCSNPRCTTKERELRERLRAANGRRR